MTTLRDLDVLRAYVRPVEYRADSGADDGSLGVMIVRFAPFDTWYEVDSVWEGRFLERIAPGAFTKTIRENGSRIKILFNHGNDPQIGDKVLGSVLDIREEPDGPVAEVSLFDTSYNRDLLPGLRAGVYGASFMFRPVKEEWTDAPEPSEHNPEGLPERVIREVRLFECGPVTWPANPAATAGMRATGKMISLTDEFYAHLRQRDPERVERLAERVGLRTPDGCAATGAAPVSSEPAIGHSAGLTPRQRRERLRPSLVIGGVS